MRKARPGGAPGNGPGKSISAKQSNSTPARFPANAPYDRPSIVELPVENFVRRPMRPSDRSLVVACYWRMRREGVRLPAERGVILIEGGHEL